MEPVTPETLTAFLKQLGETYPNQVTFYLLGGSALLLLGNPRQTLDIDYTTNLDLDRKRELEDNLKKLSAQFRLDVEAVPIEEFVPVPPGAENRRRFIGHFGNIDVYLYDLYTIALSKIARGFDTDLEDVVFLIKNGLIDLLELQRLYQIILPLSPQVDIIPQEFEQYFQELLRRFQ